MITDAYTISVCRDGEEVADAQDFCDFNRAIKAFCLEELEQDGDTITLYGFDYEGEQWLELTSDTLHNGKRVPFGE